MAVPIGGSHKSQKSRPTPSSAPAPSPAPSVETAEKQDELSGTVIRAKGNFGLIEPNEGGDPIIFLPSSCQALDGELPAEGTRVLYKTVWDEKNGRYRADPVRPALRPPLQRRGNHPAATQPWGRGDNGNSSSSTASATRGSKDSWSSWSDSSQSNGDKSQWQSNGWSKADDSSNGWNKSDGSSNGWNKSDDSWSKTKWTNDTGSSTNDSWESRGHQKDDGWKGWSSKTSWSDSDTGNSGAKWASSKDQQSQDSWWKWKDGSSNSSLDDAPWKGKLKDKAAADHTKGAQQATARSSYSRAHATVPRTQWATKTVDWASYGGEVKVFAGVLEKDLGNFGFIKPDVGEDLMFVLPWCCSEGVLPPIGTRVKYSVVTDQRNGKPRADDVFVERRAEDWSSKRAPKESRSEPIKVGDSCTGTFVRDKTSFGFLRPDGSDENFFVHPSHCTGFDGRLPPLGTRVRYTIGQRQGRLHAENVRSEEQSQAKEKFTGVFEKDNGNYGFIRQDSNQEQLFVLPWSCSGYVLPAVGTKVIFHVVTDKRTGKQRADAVTIEGDEKLTPQEPSDPPPSHATSLEDGEGDVCTGSMVEDNDVYGFILTDEGAEKIFVLASACPDGQLPAMGTRLSFRQVIHPKSGGKMADDVRLQDDDPEQEADERHSDVEEDMNDEGEEGGEKHSDMAEDDNGSDGDVHTGTLTKDKGNYGFIQPDDSSERSDQVFVLPGDCPNEQIPAVGSRVTYRFGIDGNGRRKAANVLVQQKSDDAQKSSKDDADKDEEKHEDDEDDRRLEDEDMDKEEDRAEDDGNLEEGKLEEDGGNPRSSAGAQDASPPAAEDEEMPEADQDSEEQDPSEPDVDDKLDDAGFRSYHSREWTSAWQRYCDEHGEGQRDPAEHGAAFLRKFLDDVLLPTTEDAEDLPEDLLQRVRKALTQAPKLWFAYCDRENGGNRDPSSHSKRSLQRFLHDVYFYAAKSGALPAAAGRPAKRRKT